MSYSHFLKVLPGFRYLLRRKDRKMVAVDRTVHALLRWQADQDDITMAELVWKITRYYFNSRHGVDPRTGKKISDDWPLK